MLELLERGEELVFIVGHGSLELGAIVLAGGSGLSIGWSIVAPGELPRLVSLQKRASEILVVVAGSAVMLVMAAAIEAFWSGSSAPQTVKVVVGSTLFLLVLAYVLFAGRGTDSEEAISGRLTRALEELECVSQYEYVIVNRELEKTVEAFSRIIHAEEHRRVRRENLEEWIDVHFPTRGAVKTIGAGS